MEKVDKTLVTSLRQSLSPMVKLDAALQRWALPGSLRIAALLLEAQQQRTMRKPIPTQPISVRAECQLN
jgi:hypothetical protein